MVEIFTEEDKKKYFSRMYSLRKLYEKQIPWNGVYLNNDILSNCIKSYITDLKRIKEYHPVNFANPHKRAAFTIKWIVKLRPIQIARGYNADISMLLVNEYFALNAGCSHLNVDYNKISEDFIGNLVYTFHYRPIDGNVLSTMMYLLEKSLKKESP